MNVLAIDTAHAATSVCVLSRGAGERVLAAETIPMARGHAEALLPMVDRVISASGLAIEELDRIAVVVGPGSFTGIRIGVAAARALGLAARIPALGVSSLAAFAAPLIGRREPGVIAAAVDAKHGQVYVQGFAQQGRIVLPAAVMPVRNAVRALGEGPLWLTGSGAPLLAIEAWSLGMAAEVVGETLSPDIAFVARLGALATPAQAPARPLYLKHPDAKPQANGVLARSA